MKRENRNTSKYLQIKYKPDLKRVAVRLKPALFEELSKIAIKYKTSVNRVVEAACEKAVEKERGK